LAAGPFYFRHDILPDTRPLEQSFFEISLIFSFFIFNEHPNQAF